MGLRELITEKGITQAEFAQLLGVGQSAVSMWLSGTTKPGIERLSKIASVLGVPLEKVYEAITEKPEE